MSKRVWYLQLAIVSLLLPGLASALDEPKTYTKLNLDTLTREDIADMLGWVPEDTIYTICDGHYNEPVLYYDEPALTSPGQKPPLRLSANQTTLSQDGLSTLTGDVEITQPNQKVTAEKTYLYRDPKTGDFTTVDLYGNVHFREPGTLIVAEKAHINLENETGTLTNTLYRVALGDFMPPDKTVTDENIDIYASSGWGYAGEANQDTKGIIRVSDASYTTCPPPQHIWTLKAGKLKLDRETGEGSARNARLYIKDIPIVYTPYFSFPLDHRRKTGFLFPSFGHSSRSGYHLALPFYWNMAPNYDALITPEVYTERGVQLNGDFRYLTNQSSGDIHGSILPNDRVFDTFKTDQLADPLLRESGRSRLEDAEDNRYFISIKDLRNYNQHWSSYLYFNRASDDYYFDDFDSDPAQLTDNQIINEAALYYRSQHWNMSTRVQGYQTLHPINQLPVDNQYQRLPEVMLNGHYPNATNNLDFTWNNDIVNFNKQKNPGATLDPVDGIRSNTNPGISFPIHDMAGYFTPTLQAFVTQYNLKNQLPSEDSNITRALPALSIDTGLFFDKNLELFHHAYQQTLEPRLFYLYVPYLNQDDIPLFDTDVQPFSFDQLFRVNRFNGIDRIGDADQVSLAVTTRLLDQLTGEEKLRLSAGQIFYFENRRVNITPGTTDHDLVTIANTVPSNTPSSPIVGELLYQINPLWHASASLAWDPNFNRTNNGSIAFKYQTDNRHIVNIGYTYLRGGDIQDPSDPNSHENNLNQANISMTMPFGTHFSSFAGWNYNISHGYSQSYFGGFQYDACCWAFRVVAGREFDYLRIRDDASKPVYDNRIYFEFALKGLGSIGANSATGLLSDEILGYHDHFGKL